MTDTEQEQAKHAAGEWLYFTPTADRAPFGTVIPEGLVEVVEVVDHGSATPWSPRFTYVVRAFDGTDKQGTDDRELTEFDPMAEVVPMAVFQRDGFAELIYAGRLDAAAIAARFLALGARVDMPDVWTVRLHEPEPAAPAAPVPGYPTARSVCAYCALVVETDDDPDDPEAVWTRALGAGLTGRTRECHKAPNPDEGPMPDHKPGVIARRPA